MFDAGDKTNQDCVVADRAYLMSLVCGLGWFPMAAWERRATLREEMHQISMKLWSDPWNNPSDWTTGPEKLACFLGLERRRLMKLRGPYRRHSTQLKLKLCRHVWSRVIGCRAAERGVQDPPRRFPPRFWAKFDQTFELTLPYWKDATSRTAPSLLNHSGAP